MKNLIRRAILALVLLAGAAPAFGQVPPPVPALPDTERRTSYSISSSLCNCAVGFQIFGDSTDVGNWLEVFVNGVQMTQAGNWNITSPTGSIATIPRPITDAVLTFVGPQTGTIQIVGARRPRRTSQFQESQPVPTRNFNQTFSDIIATQRELWDKTNDVTGRAVLAPPGETLALLPILANRANTGACFNAAGNLTSCAVASGTIIAGAGITLTGVNPTTVSLNAMVPTSAGGTGLNNATNAANDVLASNGTNGNFVHTALSSLLTTACTLSPSTCYQIYGYYSPLWFGAVCDGTTNDATALQSMFTAAGGKTVLFASVCVTNVSLNPVSNTTITGNGWNSGIKSSACLPIFNILNKSDITISNLWLQGTDACVSWAASTHGALLFTQDATANPGARNIIIRRTKFSGFNSNFWVYITTTGAALTVDGVVFEDNWILSVLADIPTDGVTTNNGNDGFVVFSSSGGNGQIKNVRFRNNRIDGTALCFPVNLFANISHYDVSDNLILNPGNTNTVAHCTNGLPSTNSYGIIIYDPNGDGFPPTDGIISRNTIISPVSAGIYLTGDGGHFDEPHNRFNVEISNNYIIGQSATDDATLPRAAISVALATGVTASGNILENNYGGIAFVAQNAGAVSAFGNHCTSFTGGSFCLKLQSGANGSSNIDRRIIRGNLFDGLTNSILTVSSTGARFNSVDISGNSIGVTGTGLNLSSSFASGQVAVIANNFLQGAGTPANFTSATGNLYLSANTNLSFTAATLPSAFSGSSVFVSDGAPASACTGGSSGSTGFRQNGAWKCF